MNERLGIVEQRQADRARYERFAYRPPVILNTPPKPAPKRDVVERVPTPQEAMYAEIVSLRNQNAWLRKKLGMSAMGPLAEADNSLIGIREVQDAFCTELAAVGYTLDGRPYTLDDLKNCRRSRGLSQPRQVCVALVRDLCRWASSTMIGKAFGKRDHTTIMHACIRAPEILAANPALRAAHAKVLETFKAAE